MINYKPLRNTLSHRNITLEQLMAEFNDYSLRARLNGNKPITFSTLEKMCKFLNCKVEDIIMYEEGESKSISWIRGYIVDWPKVFDMIQKKGKKLNSASKDLGYKPSYLYNIVKGKITSRKVVHKLAFYLDCDVEVFAKEVRRN
ncbi:MAG: transcriptional regulator [Bacilli bacterium]|nr:transcriptional regulator [Bacilli bacterium]